jgi:hypothetical protein
MSHLEWVSAIEFVEPHILRIMTQDGSGTGFLVSHATTNPICAIATAAHVVKRAHYWEQPIRLEHKESGKSLLLRPADRAIFPDERKDTAAIVFAKSDFPLPSKPLDLAPEGKWLKIGVEIGWLGFPAVSPPDLCFFSGRVSCHWKTLEAYLVDGVAIHGVSGGPAFAIVGDRLTLIGVVSAYLANRATGETLPGLSVVTNVAQFQELSKTFKSMDEAKERETPPTPPDHPGETPNPTFKQMRQQTRHRSG